MGTKLEPKDQELYQRVDEVLHYLWDPIRVSGVPMARDEYYNYIPQIFSLLKQRASVETIAAYLDNLVVEHIGLNSNLNHCSEVALTCPDFLYHVDLETGLC
jgi:hypothetical protein